MQYNVFQNTIETDLVNILATLSKLLFFLLKNTEAKNSKNKPWFLHVMNLVNDHNYINSHLLSTYVQGTTFSIIFFSIFAKTLVITTILMLV